MIQLGSGGAVGIDLVFLQLADPAERYHGLPTSKPLATQLIDDLQPGVLRMGGGSINARVLGDMDAKNATAWGRGYSWLRQRGANRPPCMNLDPNIKIAKDRVSISSLRWGIFDFLDMCNAGNVTAVVTLIEKDSGADFVEYLWGGPSTPFGALRAKDGHAARYQTEKVAFEIGNERQPTLRERWCVDTGRNNSGDCVQSWLDFAESAQAKALELGLADKLVLILPFTPSFTSFAHDMRLKSLVHRAAEARMNILWDQHIGLSTSCSHPAHYPYAGYCMLSSVYEGWPQAMAQMANVTAQWRGGGGKPGVRGVVLEENGDQIWGVNSHTLSRALNHAQTVAALQRVPSSAPNISQVAMSTQANCLQADQQNYYTSPPDGHANSWDQGGLFYNAQGTIWGQPQYFAAKMMAGSHLPIVVEAQTAAPTWTPQTADFGVANNWSVPSGLDVIALHSRAPDKLTIRVVNPQNFTISSHVSWTGLRPTDDGQWMAQATVLTSASLNDSNTAADTTRVRPTPLQAVALRADGMGLASPMAFPNGSLTIVTVSGRSRASALTMKHDDHGNFGALEEPEERLTEEMLQQSFDKLRSQQQPLSLGDLSRLLRHYCHAEFDRPGMGGVADGGGSGPPFRSTRSSRCERETRSSS